MQARNLLLTTVALGPLVAGSYESRAAALEQQFKEEADLQRRRRRLERLMAALDKINPDIIYDRTRVVTGMFHLFAGSNRGLELVHDWIKRNAKNYPLEAHYSETQDAYRTWQEIGPNQDCVDQAEWIESLLEGS